MKRSVSGRRFSRIERTEFDSDDELLEHISAEADQDFAARLSRLVGAAERVLSDSKLPTAARLWWRYGSDEIESVRPRYDEYRGGCSLDIYVKKECGYKHDDIQAIAAEIIVVANRMDQARGDARDALAFRLGELYNRAWVRLIDARDHARRGASGLGARWSGNAGSVVRTLASSLAGRRDELGDYLPPSELWPELYALMDRAHLSPTEEGNGKGAMIHYDGDGGEPYTYEAFRKLIQRENR